VYLGFEYLCEVVTIGAYTQLVITIPDPSRVHSFAHTVHTLFRVLNSFIVEENQNTAVIHLFKSEYGHHPLGGEISEKMRAWICAYATEHEKNTMWGMISPLPRGVKAAMREVWRTLSPSGLKKYANAASGSLRSDGRFILGCSGDACDVAIYPGYGNQFDCHNLDTAQQQITLFAGLVKLIEIAERRILQHKPG
jgi:hypothetical protein